MTRNRCPGQDPRYWTSDEVCETRCPHCGLEMEFFNDEPARTCRSCRKKVRNPKFDPGCAKWCKYADECLGKMPQTGGRSAE